MKLNWNNVLLILFILFYFFVSSFYFHTKAIHEESIIWLASIVVVLIPSIIFQSTEPITTALTAEAIFLFYCTTKLLFKFNKPILPEPILRKNWEDVASFVWSSQKDVKSRRSYLMGWYYDAPFDTLREEDALSYLAWMRYGVPIEEEYGMLSEEDINQLRSFDLPLLLNKVNYGKSLPLRGDDEEPLSVMRFNCEPLRYRHKPILFYGIIHSIGFLLHKVLEVNGFKYVPAVNSKKDLAYWYRLPEPQVSSTDRMNTDDNDDTTTTTTMDPPLVFAHGIGGLAFCYKLIDDLLHDKTVKDKTPIILMDLPHISLRIHDDIPQIKSQVESICKIIDNVVSRGSGSGGEAQAQGQGSKSPNKATFVGHSFGTLLLSWMVQSNPERVAGCVFLGKFYHSLHLEILCFPLFSILYKWLQNIISCVYTL
jgi:hypothetical protein